MIYVKCVLSTIASMFISVLLVALLGPFRGISEQKAIGLAAVAGGFIETSVSPLFWIVTMWLFAAIFAASQIKNKALQATLFWVPTLFICTLAVGMAALISYALHFRHG